MDIIREHEEMLRQAMLAGDVDALNRLIADDLVFVTHFGAIMGKNDDLEAHRRKLFSLSRLDFTEQAIRKVGDAMVTVTMAELEGVWDEPFTDALVYMRVWRDAGAGKWQVAAGQATRRELL